jgi:hypothetical protein
MIVPISKHGEVKSVGLMWEAPIPKLLVALDNLRRVEIGWDTQEASIVKLAIPCIRNLQK